jgi:hypothetical protein
MPKAKKQPEAKNQPEAGDYSEWFRSSDETGTGFVSGNTFLLKQVEYSVIDGMAIFEGDIALGPVDQLDVLSADVPRDQLPVAGIGIVGERFRWPGGIVPWQSVPELRQRVLDAIAHWETHTNIRFVERTAGNQAQYPNFLSFQVRDGCWSFVGMQGGEQVVSLAAGCGFGAAVHEIFHAVGAWHEQSRGDRDQFIRIAWENIQPGREHNFNQHVTDGDDIGTYDFDSIMHYPSTAFSKNGQPTIITLGGQQVGQRSGLSAGDIAAVNSMYPMLQPSQSWSGVQFRGTVLPGVTQGWFTHSWPSHWYVVWMVVPTGPIQDQAPQVEWKVQVERQTETLLKYYIYVTNLSSAPVHFEARYTVLGWSQWAS